MKLIFLATSGSIHSYRWVDFFLKQDYEVIWISFDKKLYDPPKHVEYIEINHNRIISLVKCLFKIRSIKPSLIHAHYVGYYGLAALLSKYRYIITPWGSDLLLNKTNFFKKLFISLILRNSELVTYDGENIKREISQYGIKERKIRNIKFGIDTKKFSNINTQKTNQFRIVSTRVLDDIYDLKTLIKSFAIVLRKFPNSDLFIANDGKLRNNLQRQAAKLGIKDRVFFTGKVPNDKMPEFLSEMDIYVSTALSDGGLSCSTAEAMSCELPVVISNSSDNAQWVKDKYNGMLFDCKNHEMLAAKIIYLFQNSEIMRSIGQRGRKEIVSKFNLTKEKKKMMDIYDGFLTKPIS